MWEILIKHCD